VEKRGMSASEPPAARCPPTVRADTAATELAHTAAHTANTAHTAGWTATTPPDERGGGGTQTTTPPDERGGGGAQTWLALGRYRLQRRLGAGAFGTVWMAHDERLGREVAVKILPRERVLGGRFEREARAAARLAHPGIVTLYEAAVDDEGAYLVSELVRGETLRALLQKGRLSDRDILAIGISLCDALAYAHAQGVIHRDVKPSNILIPDRPSSRAHPAKLTDFGVARVIGGDSLTRTGDAIGTAAYMAPEQAEGREAGAPADLYALAIVIYEALSGVNPVSVGTGVVRARRLGVSVPPLRRQRRELPREVGRGIDLALRPRPRERGTLSELRLALSVSLDAVADRPGVVAGAWPHRTAEDALAPGPAPAGELASAGDRDAIDPRARRRWPARGLAAVSAASTTAWLGGHLLGTSPLAPAALAILAAVFVLALPRIGWVALTGALVAAAAAQGRAGGSLALALAAVLPVILLPRTGVAWPLAAGAPALGLLGLAGAWPALAGRARRAWCRAALGLIGWLWLTLGAALAGADLYAQRPSGTPAPAVWTESLTVTFHDVLIPVMRSGILAGAPVWALAAVVLPWLLGRRSLGIQAVLVSGWAAATAAGTQVAIAAFHGPGAVVTPAGALIGALAAGLAALAPGLHAGWRERGSWRGGVASGSSAATPVA
jgi:hypothetical protein